MNADMLKLISGGLKRHGYDGLYIEDSCACKLDDLAPCGELGEDCRPGVFTKGPCSNCEGGKPCAFHIGPKAKSDMDIIAEQCEAIDAMEGRAHPCKCCGAAITPNDRTDACPQCGRMRCVHCDAFGRSCRVCEMNKRKDV